MAVAYVGVYGSYFSASIEADTGDVSITLPSATDGALFFLCADAYGRTHNIPTFAGSSAGINQIATHGTTPPGVAAYVLVNPPAGTNDIRWTISGGNSYLYFTAVLCSGVDQSTPNDAGTVNFATDANGNFSTALTIPADGLGLSVSGLGNTVTTFTATGTDIESSNVIYRRGSQYETLTGAQSIGRSGWGGNRSWSQLVIPVRPAAGGPSGLVFPPVGSEGIHSKIFTGHVR